MALQWKLKNIEVKMNSVTVLACVESVFTKNMIRTKAEILLKRRLGIKEDISKEFFI